MQTWKVQESEFSLTGSTFLNIGIDSENKGVEGLNREVEVIPAS